MSQIIDALIEREGDYSDNPTDRGGPTRWGITQATLADWRGHPVTAEDVQNLTRAEASDLYEARYVKPFQRFEGGQQLMDLCVDSAVQHGVARVQGWLQAIPSNDPDVNYKGLLQRRIRFYGEIITGDPTQAVFAEGWLNRVSEFVR